MSFYENNIQRIRSDLKNLLYDDTTTFIPCSNKVACTIKDMISEDDNVILPPIDDESEPVEQHETEPVGQFESEPVGQLESKPIEQLESEPIEQLESEYKSEPVIEIYPIDKHLDNNNEYSIYDKDLKVQCNVDTLLDSDSEVETVAQNSDSDTNDSDIDAIEDVQTDDSDYEKEINIIRDNETELRKLKTNYFNNESVPITFDDNDDFVNNLIKREIEDVVYINYKNKPYKIEINSAEPESGQTESREDKDHHCNKTYTNFDAFYENYIDNHPDFKQLDIFNKIISTNLNQHPFLTDIVNHFRNDIVEIWVKKFKNAQTVYNFVDFDAFKWVKRAEMYIFNAKIKKPILEYIKTIGSIIVLFDVELSFQLNKHLYKNIEFENVKPLNLKKDIYTVQELINYHNYGKNISKTLIQDIVDNITLNQNVNILNLDIRLYNKIFDTNLNEMQFCIVNELQTKVNQYILQDNNFPDILKQPIIYIDPDDHRVYIFEYHKLCKNFDEKKYINPYTNKPFEQEFIEQCLEKMKNINLCNYCKDNCTKQTLRTIYQDPNFGPIILKFCSVHCFSDIEWKPKVLLNTIV